MGSPKVVPMGNAPRLDGSAVKRLRQARGLSQAQLAGRVSASRFHLTNIERGQKQPSFSLALALAEALDVTVEDLVTRQPATAGT